MKINKTTTYGVGTDPTPGKETDGKKKVSSSPSDNIHVSAKARALYEADQSKKLREVDERIGTGYYFTPSVTAKVVDALISLFSHKSQS